MSEGIFHSVPDLVRNFYTVSAWPGHERNLMVPDFAAHGRDCVAESQDRLWVPCGRSLLSFCDLERSCAHRVTIENKPSRTGVVRRIALSDHWRWVSTPRWARTSANVTSTCHLLTNHARISPGRALRSVARNACGSSSPVGSRTR